MDNNIINCRNCTHWEVADFCKDYESWNQSGACNCNGCGQVYVNGDGYVDTYETTPEQFCSNFKAR